MEVVGDPVAKRFSDQPRVVTSVWCRPGSLYTHPTTREQAAETLEAGAADAVTIGRGYLANPGLVRRWTEGAELNEMRPAFRYRGGAEGYTDYPVLPGRSASRLGP